LNGASPPKARAGASAEIAKNIALAMGWQETQNNYGAHVVPPNIPKRLIFELYIQIIRFEVTGAPPSDYRVSQRRSRRLRVAPEARQPIAHPR
jgi:hypothetical protein